MLANVLQEDDTSFLSISAISEGSMTRPEPSLHRSEIQGTVLLTRLKDDEICRKVPLTSTRNVKSLFQRSAERWPEKFAAEEISRLLYVDGDNHLVEIVKESSSDFKDFLRMIARRWNSNDGAEVIYIEVYLLAAGESVQL